MIGQTNVSVTYRGIIITYMVVVVEVVVVGGRGGRDSEDVGQNW